MIEPSEFVNKIVVVTGGAQGIGACISQTFINAGAIVFFSDIDSRLGKKREKILNESAGDKKATFIKADLRSPTEIKAFADAILKQHKGIDVLINNAGIFSKKSLANRSLTEWNDIIALNLSATFMCTKQLSKALIKNNGNIINIASTRALMSEADTEPYSASKGGIVALTHSLAISLGKNKIRVNCISPGWIETSGWHFPPHQPKLRKIDHEQHPAGRVGKPEDIAHAALFLASNQLAGFITGHNLVVDGGMTKKMIYAE